MYFLLTAFIFKDKKIIRDILANTIRLLLYFGCKRTRLIPKNANQFCMKCFNAKVFTIFATSTTTTHTHTHKHKNTLTEHVYKKVSHFGNKINFKKLLVSLFFGFFLIIFFWGGGYNSHHFQRKKTSH